MEGINQNKRVHAEGESDFRPWDDLCPDALGLIFKDFTLQELLQVIPRVCKSWGKVVKGPYCWQRIDIDKWSWKHRYMPKDLDRMLRMLITRSSGSLLHLSVQFVNDDQLSFIAEHAGSLQTLILKRSSLTDSVVEKVAAKFSSLTSLDLCYAVQISTRALEAIGRNCKKLVSLGWKRDRSFKKETATDEARAIARTMPKLKHLYLSYLNINTEAALEILSACPELDSMYIPGCDDVDRKLLKKTYPKVLIMGPYNNMGFFDGDYSDYSDYEWDTWNDASSGIDSPGEDDGSWMIDYYTL